MNARKTGWLFFVIIIIYLGGSFGAVFLPQGLLESLVGNTLFSEALIWVPAVLFLWLNRERPVSFCGFRRMHVSTAFMSILFAFMVMPAATLMNIISLFFVENTVVQMSGSMIQAGFFTTFLLVAVYAPFAEELVFRGALFQGLKESASPWKAVFLSALFFGLMHMNFNQAGYAFVLGIFMALAVEATGSIWSSVLLHIAVNGRSVVMLFVSEKLTGLLQDFSGGTQGISQEAAAAVTQEQLFMMLGLEILLVVICLPIAGCILVWMAKKEGRLAHIRSLWNDRKAGRVFSVPAALAIIICIGFMIYIVL